MGGKLNENLLAILLALLAVYLVYVDTSSTDVVKTIIYSILGYLIGKRLHGGTDTPES